MPSSEVPAATRERTGLAWQRSAFAFAGLAAVALGAAARREAPGLLALSATLLVIAGAVWRHGRHAYVQPQVQAQPRVLALLAVATALAALAAGVAVIARF